MYEIGFIIEQALGHITHTKNLQRNIPRDTTVNAHWRLIAWEASGIGARVPIYNSNWTVRAGVRARRAVADLARKIPLDALFFHTQVPAILATNWVRRIPSVVSLDATPLQYDALGAAYGHAAGPAWLERRKWQLNRDCFRAARRLVAWSNWAKQGLVADYEVPPGKIEVIPPGVNPDEWARRSPRLSAPGPVKILFVGGDLERKGGLLLLDAVRELGSPDVELHMVTRAQVPARAGVHVYHDMLPNSDALKRLYHDCDIFCLPTTGDCLPMVLSEAGAAGLPTVSTRVAGIPEIVRDGETGFLVNPGDGTALTAALRRLVENPNLRLQQGGRAVEVVKRDFDAGHNAERVIEILKQTADDERATRRVSR